MRVFVGLCALVLWFAWCINAHGATLDCGGDADCEQKAQVLCDQGHIEWCEEKVT